MFAVHNCRCYKYLKFNSLIKCFCTTASTTTVSETKKEKSPNLSTINKLKRYIASEPHLKAVREYIPEKYIAVKHSKVAIDSIYLIDSKIAKDIVKHILPKLTKQEDQIIAETNAGLGLIASELLDQNVKLVRLYESCAEFRNSLKTFNDVYPGRVELFKKNLFYSYTLSYLDKIDNGNRVDGLLEGVTKKAWTDVPFMTVIGTMPNIRFIKYLLKTLALQTDFAKYGRLQLFVLMIPRDYVVLTANSSFNLHTYRTWSVLFNLFFEHEFIEKYPRKAFLPWEYQRKITPKIRYPETVDTDCVYLVRITHKKNLPVKTEHILPLFYFIRQFFGSGTNKVIPTVEKWIPSCGLNILLPQLQQTKFREDIDIFTQFGNLEPDEILSIFKEVMNHPGYSESPFLAMVESQLLKSETIETDLVRDNIDKDVHEDIDEKIENT